MVDTQADLVSRVMDTQADLVSRVVAHAVVVVAAWLWLVVGLLAGSLVWLLTILQDLPGWCLVVALLVAHALVVAAR